MRQHANACRAIRPNCVAGEHLPDKDAVSRQRMPRSLQPADRVDAQNRRPELPSGALCQADQSPALPSCASFLPWKDMLSLSFPRLAGKPILVLWLCLAHQHPACTHRHVDPSCHCVRGRMDRHPSCFGEERLLRKAADRAAYELFASGTKTGRSLSSSLSVQSRFVPTHPSRPALFAIPE